MDLKRRTTDEQQKTKQTNPLFLLKIRPKAKIIVISVHHLNILILNSCTLALKQPSTPYLWMLPVPGLWQCARQSGCRHQR